MKIVFVLMALVSWSAVEARRDKRYIYFNTDSAMTLGFIINFPFSLALPTIIYAGRSLDRVNNLNMTGDRPQDYYPDSNYVETLDKMTSYFSFMEVPSVSCQLRLTCELAVNPDEYAPVSTLILKDLWQKYGRINRSNKSLMWQYMKAARTGYSSTPEDCALAYPRCPEPAHKLLNMAFLKLVQFILNKFGIIMM